MQTVKFGDVTRGGFFVHDFQIFMRVGDLQANRIGSVGTGTVFGIPDLTDVHFLSDTAVERVSLKVMPRN